MALTLGGIIEGGSALFGGLFGAGEAAAGAVGSGIGELASGVGGALGSAGTALGLGGGGAAGEAALGGAEGALASGGAGLSDFASASIPGAQSAFGVGGGAVDLGSTAFGAAGDVGVSGGSAGGAGGAFGAASGPVAPSAGGGSTFDSLLASAKGVSPTQAAGLGLGAGALGYNIFKGSQTSPEQRHIQNSAAQLSQQGQQLAQYLQSGNLPPGIQQAVRQASAAARARVISNHAASGMSTDPNQNSALAQELNAIDEQAIIQTAQIGQQLLTTGINEVGLANNLYMQLVNMNRQQGQSTGAAIGNFAAALAGSGRTQNKGTTNNLVNFG